jgi:hypothetical protein
MRIKLVVSYDGTDFCGWAPQAGLRTVQGTLTEAVRRVSGEEIEILGASRTDSGAHARGQVCHFDVKPGIPDKKWAAVLNRGRRIDRGIDRVSQPIFGDGPVLPLPNWTWSNRPDEGAIPFPLQPLAGRSENEHSRNASPGISRFHSVHGRVGQVGAEYAPHSLQNKREAGSRRGVGGRGRNGLSSRNDAQNRRSAL